jgi:hypothetical protein
MDSVMMTFSSKLWKTVESTFGYVHAVLLEQDVLEAAVSALNF